VVTQFLNSKALTEASAEERNTPKKVHFIGGGSPKPSLVPPWNRGSPALRERGFSMRAPHKAARTLRPNKVQKKKVGKIKLSKQKAPANWSDRGFLGAFVCGGGDPPRCQSYHDFAAASVT